MTVLAAFTMQDMEDILYPERAEFAGRGKDKQKRKSRFGLSAGQKRRLEGVPVIGKRFKRERLDEIAIEGARKHDGRRKLYRDLAIGAGGLAALGVGGAAAMRYGGAGLAAAKSAAMGGLKKGDIVRSGATRIGQDIAEDFGRATGYAARKGGEALGFAGRNKVALGAGAAALGAGGYLATQTETGRKASRAVGRAAGSAGRYAGGVASKASRVATAPFRVAGRTASKAMGFAGRKAGQAKDYAGRQTNRLRDRYAL